MKNKILLLSSLLVLGGLVSCGGEAESKVKVALGYDASYEVYDHYNKLANCLTVNAAAVGFGEDGKILDVRFDSIQVYYGATKAEGAEDWTYAPAKGLTNDHGIKSKLELGKDYNMYNNPYGSTLSEVDTQIEAFADLCVGKTVAEVEAITEEQAAEVGVTIVYEMYVNALKDAANKQRAAVAYTGELKAGVGMAGTFEKTYTGDIEASITVSAGLVTGDKLVASYTDCVVYQTSGAVVNAEKNNNIELPGKEGQKYVVNGKITSKFDLGDAYGMAKYGTSTLEDPNAKAIEWDDQALAFDAVVAGKTVAEIEDLDFTAGVQAGITMHADDLVFAVTEAITYANLVHVGPQWNAE